MVAKNLLPNHSDIMNFQDHVGLLADDTSILRFNISIVHSKLNTNNFFCVFFFFYFEHARKPSTVLLFLHSFRPLSLLASDASSHHLYRWFHQIRQLKLQFARHYTVVIQCCLFSTLINKQMIMRHKDN